MPSIPLLLLALAATAHPTPPVEWTGDLEDALTRAAEEGRVVFLALGEVGEARSERHLDEVYDARALRGAFEAAVNVAAWSYDADTEGDLPDFDGGEPREHRDRMGEIVDRWLRANDEGVVALPQHAWLSPAGELLLSVPFEVDAEELAWCFDEAFRRAGVADAPAADPDARPPRRLLLGDAFKLPDDDPLGRGLRPDELAPLLDDMSRRTLTMRDGEDVRRVLFTDEPDAVEFLEDQYTSWDLLPALGRILDGTIHLVGLAAPASHLPTLAPFADHPRASLRAQVAVAYEQIGDSAGLAVVKKALGREDDPGVRAEWARAYGACGRGERSVARALVKLAEKDDDERVRLNAVLALGHVLPQADAREHLLERLSEGDGAERRAALLALALARDLEARDAIAALGSDDHDEPTRTATEAALRVLDGGNLVELREPFQEVSGSDIDRWRLFFWRG